jgi:CRP-like cAMP-binding protein
VRLKEYYDYLWVEHKSEDHSSHFFYYPDLSENLKDEIAESLSLKTMPLRRVDSLSDLSPMAFTKVLMAVVSPLIYMPGDVVFHSTEHAEELFFVSKGDLRLYPKEIQEDWESDAALEKCTEIGENAFIGESKMVLESKWETTLVSVDFSELASLARADLFLILAEFPQYRDRLDRKISQETAKVGINKIKTALREKGRDLSEEELRALKPPPAKNTLDGQIDAMASSGKAGPEQIVALIKQQNQMFKALTTAVNQHGMTLRKIQANVNAASHGM